MATVGPRDPAEPEAVGRVRRIGLTLIIRLLELTLQVGQIFHISLNLSIELWFPNSTRKHFSELMGILNCL